jgi:hypothetical protein
METRALLQIRILDIQSIKLVISVYQKSNNTHSKIVSACVNSSNSNRWEILGYKFITSNQILMRFVTPWK